MPELFVVILHLLMLIWSHSPNYSTPRRLVVPIIEIANDVVANVGCV